MGHDGTMRCRHCSELQAEALRPELSPPTVGVVAGVVCAHCGAMIGPVDFASRLVVKLAELQRFGLTGPDEVLRPPSPPPSRTRGR
jgi:phage FluMu protein Com